VESQNTEPTIGRKIKKYRELEKLTQKELGERCGIDAANIRKYENGKQNPKVETVKKIAAALGIPWSELYPTVEEVIPFIQKRILSGKATFDNVSQTLESPVYLMPESEEELIKCFRALNETGKKVAAERLSELAQLPQYQKQTNQGVDTGNMTDDKETKPK